MVALYLRRSILETSLGDETILGSVDGREVLLYRLGKAPGIQASSPLAGSLLAPVIQSRC
jgi:hypothetical protein